MRGIVAGYVAGAMLGVSGLAIAVVVPVAPQQAPPHTTQLPDTDGDGIPDIFDGCPGIPNIAPEQDSDGDGLRDECDLDPSGGGITPLVGAMPMLSG